MLAVHEALDRVMATARRAPAETVPLALAHGRVLAEDVRSEVDVPPWDGSAMDGYAVRAADLRGEETTLRLLEVVRAGELPRLEVREGSASAVMTGAPMPGGADAVVPVEDSDRALSGAVTLRGGTQVGRYVRRRGCDIAAGSVVVAAGARLGAGALGLLASIGRTELAVVRQPRVGILGTGDEVVRPGSPRTGAQIWSSNHISLAALVTEAGGVPVDLGHAADDPAALDAALARGMELDLVLTTGGVSAGAYDLVRGALERAGVAVGFWKVRVKPGMPVVFGQRERAGGVTTVFGLPGNPVSCMVNFLLLVRPWLRATLGDPRPHLPRLAASAGHDIPSSPGRARLERVRLEAGPAGWTCWTTGDQSSGVLRSMAGAHGLLLLAPEDPGPRAGDAVEVLLVDASFLDRSHHDLAW